MSGYLKNSIEEIALKISPAQGLGFAICKSIVEAHGGSISARARRDDKRGSVIKIRLPLQFAEKDREES
ncbi:ATP-binding protein [Paenibacillus sp. V4I7]|uniref:ATP-binding protein n=1 Tax=Paenibacillus sp. V4I7 TaxID=3042307 RepID=UPI003593C411